MSEGNGKAEGWDAIADALDVSTRTAQSFERRQADDNPLVVAMDDHGLVVVETSYLESWKVAEAQRRTARRNAKLGERVGLRRAS